MKNLILTKILFSLSSATHLNVFDSYGAVQDGASSGTEVTRVQSQEECDRINEGNEQAFEFD